MSLYDAFLNTINKNIKRLANEPKRSHNIYNILQIASRPGMGVDTTNGNILLCIKPSIPKKKTEKI
jgi:hypothetical protein